MFMEMTTTKICGCQGCTYLGHTVQGMQPDVVEHLLNPSTARRISEFEGNLVYVGSFRPARAT